MSLLGFLFHVLPVVTLSDNITTLAYTITYLYIIANRYEIESAGRRFPAELNLGPVYQPKT